MAKFEPRAREEKAKPEDFTKPSKDVASHLSENATKAVLTDAIKGITLNLFSTYSLFRYRTKQREETPTMTLTGPEKQPVSISAECENLRVGINRLREQLSGYVEIANELEKVGWSLEELLAKDKALAQPFLDVGILAVNPDDLK